MVILKCQKQKVMVMLKFTHDTIEFTIIFINCVSVVEGNDWKYFERSFIFDYTVSITHFLDD